MQMTLHDIDHALKPAGLLTLGCFNPTPADGVPDSVDGCSLVLVGNAGPDMWRVFSQSGDIDSDPNPLDSWSRRIVEGIGDSLSRQFGVSVTALFPFDGPPYMPFQRWASRSGCVHPTPIGPMLHEKYGMWHAYRGAFVIATPLDIPAPVEKPSPCLSCTDKPCLTRCPVGAFSADGYDVPACLDVLEKESEGDCFSGGCLARKACPIGQDYFYERPQARFHMEKFLKAHRP